MQYHNGISKEQAWQKIKKYAAYQERSHQEIRAKLYTYGLFKKDVETLISELISEDFLNEERFAIQFAGGKHRMKYWGKKKIEYALRERGVSSFCIKNALEEIDYDLYKKNLLKMAKQKWDLLKKESTQNRIFKTKNYLLQKYNSKCYI